MTTQSNDICARMSALIATSAQNGTLKRATLSKPADKQTVKCVLTLRKIGKSIAIQAETFRADNKALHENIALDDLPRLHTILESFSQVNLLTTVGDCEFRRSKSGKCIILNEAKITRALQGDNTPAAEIMDNNKQKNRILSGNEPFLRLLDVSDENGRVRDKKQSKFRQINRFLELIRDCLPNLPAEGALRICDLCCGKSYLSFAAYHYFTNVLGRQVRMTGVDLKSDVIAYCNEVAEKLGFDGLSFLCGDINEYHVEEKVHLVISLHACDTATDLVLGKAMEWNTDVILSTPCCHHELNHTLNCAPLAFIAEHSMLRQKFCDAATDALRLKLLEANGYSVSALELIDPEETPKNIMLRALRRKSFQKDSPEAARLMEEYTQAKQFLLGT